MRDDSLNFDAVCVGAHPDDVEIGMGATVAKLTSAGRRVAIVDLTNGEPTPHGSPEIRAAEAEQAASVLHATRITLTQPNRYLFDSVEARFELAAVLREYRPRMLFLPYPDDAHPDHVAASAIGLAARFYGKLSKTDLDSDPYFVPFVFRYAAVHQRMVVEPSFVVDVSGHLETKLQAIAAYRSQFGVPGHNEGMSDSIRALARTWGALGGVGGGEPFFALEPLAVATPEVFLT